MLLYVKNIEDVDKFTTQIQILDICNFIEHQDILDYIDDNKLIKEFCQQILEEIL